MSLGPQNPTKNLTHWVDFLGELQEDLNSVIQWANQNIMALHEDKLELMVHTICPQSHLYEFQFTADALQGLYR